MISPVIVTGKFVQSNGNPARVTVSFQLTAVLVDSAGNVIAPRKTHNVRTDNDGNFVTELLPTNHPDVQPENVMYKVSESSQGSSRTYFVTIPYDREQIDLTELVPAEASDVHEYAVVQGTPVADFNNHAGATLNVHGIPDTSNLATQDQFDNLVVDGYTLFSALEDTSVDAATDGQVPAFDETTGLWIPDSVARQEDIDTHTLLIENIHGISDTSLLETQSGAQDKADSALQDAIGHVDDVLPAHSAETQDVHGIPDTSVLETQSGAQSRIDAHDNATGVHGVGTSTVASTDNVNAAQSAAQDHADTAVSDHNAATSVHGVDTTQLATQDDLANLEPLPEPGDDGDVLTLADGSPTWAAPEGGGGLDPDGEEVITGDWSFDAPTIDINTDGNVRIGRETGHGPFTNTVVGHWAGRLSSGRSVTLIGHEAGRDNSGHSCIFLGRIGLNNSGDTVLAIGHHANAGQNNTGNRVVMIGAGRIGRSNTGNACIFLGAGAGNSNTRDNRLIIVNDDNSNSEGNLTDPLIDGRFRDGTDSDDFEYSKGVKVNGHLEATDQLILRSPDGSRWAITVDDSGNLSTSPATEEITP